MANGSSVAIGLGAGIILKPLDRTKFRHALLFNFPASNKEAAYEALIAREHLYIIEGVKKIKIYTDCQLVAGQIRGEFETKEQEMVRHKWKIKELARKLEKFEIPMAIVFDHRVQFEYTPIREYLKEYRVKMMFALVCLPTMRFQDTVKESTGETPFKLAFISEVILPEEVELRTTSYKDSISKAYNKKVKGRKIEEGDLVLRRTVGDREVGRSLDLQDKQQDNSNGKECAADKVEINAQAVFLPAVVSDHSPGVVVGNNTFPNIHIEIEDAHNTLVQIQKELQGDPTNRDLCYKEKKATDQYKKKLQCYVQFLQQKARIKWL
ncbi:Ribonuclease HI [Bienertia sinuspersici]